MAKRNTLVLIILLALFAFCLWVLLPIEGERFGRQGIRLGLDLKGGLHMVYKADMSAVEKGQETSVIEGVIAVIQNRINPLGVTEPVIERLGADQIVVELPGASITDVEKGRIGRTALLEFGELVQEGETAKWTDDLGQWKPATAVIDGQEKELTSAYFKENTYVNTDQMGRVLLIFQWDEEGSKLSEAITSRLIDKPLGIFEGDEPLLGDDGRPIAPTVQVSDYNQWAD